ncbi:hypothetical protein Tco_1077024 [Tanacetum coccineum]
MGEITMEEYITITHKDNDSVINEKGRIELKGRFLLELRDNAFSRTNGEDVVEHIENFLKMVDLLNVPNVTHDRLRNALWDYWRRGNDEEVITNDELSNPRGDNLIDENEIAQIFRIDTDIFHFETPLCEAFKEFYYLSQINVDVLIKGIHGFKSYEEYKDDWIYEWNDEILWVNEKPWIDDGKEDGYCNTGDLPRLIQEGNLICYQDYEWYATIEDSELKEEALNNKAILEESMNVEGESSDDAYIETDASSNQNTYTNVCQIVMDHNETQGKHGWFDKHELMGDDDDDIGNLEDYLIRKDPPYYVNEDEEKSKERRCKLNGIPYVKPPTYKSKKF